MKPSRKTILVVDDDWTTRGVLERMLGNEGYKVVQAERGEKGLFLALEQTIDGFLLDIRMPGMGGIDLCRRLRAMDRYRMTPVLFVTAMDEQSKLQEAFGAGAGG